jgi:CheY-like chemotaxis protein
MALVLVIHAYNEQREALSLMLSEADHMVIEAAPGADGLSKFATYAPDLIVTDVFMPEADGIEALVAIRTRPNAPRIVAISYDPQFRGVIRTATADAVIAAPFTQAHFIATVSHHLEETRPRGRQKPVLWAAQLDAEGRSIECLLLNVSMDGAMLQVPAPVTGHTVTLQLPRFGSFTAEVKWQQDNKLGIGFTDTPDKIAQGFARTLSFK